jgi:uncharacterized membrane protein
MMPPSAFAPPARPAITGLLGAYPLALLTAALATDIAYAETAQMQWANFSVWLIAGGAALGVVALLAQLAARRRADRPLGGVLFVAALVTAVLNGFVHSRDAWTSVVPTGLALSALTSVLVVGAALLGSPAARA